MAGQARIILFTWIWTPPAVQQEPSTPGSPSWTQPLSQVGDQGASRRVGAGLVGWRLIGANNRELGRAANPNWSVDEARQAVREVQLAFDRSLTRLSWSTVEGWSWQISLDGDVVAVSDRGYRRQRECAYSVELFRERLPTAEVLMPHTRRPRSKSIDALSHAPISVVAIPVGEIPVGKIPGPGLGVGPACEVAR